MAFTLDKNFSYYKSPSALSPSTMLSALKSVSSKIPTDEFSSRYTLGLQERYLKKCRYQIFMYELCFSIKK